MSYNFNQDFFINSIPNIENNSNLRQPQLEAYFKIVEYFKNDFKNRNALIVLPTGVGKTGVIALAPFRVCKKRTLVITPGTTIKNTVLDDLDPTNPRNFWYETKVFQYGFPLPNVIEYEGKNTPYEVLNAANIVILNIQKLQDRLESSLINLVDKDFFDLIIIDEAHHSTANTWTKCVDFFDKAKIIKLTGTPFRTDGEKINGELIYKYSLARAMSNNFIKSLSNIEFTPDELKLTLDNNENRFYTIDEIYALGLKDKDWVTRSVAFSEECSRSIVDESINALKEKKINSNIPHKIIAIACSITHAKQIAKLYLDKGIKTTIIHSNLSTEEKNSAFKDIENNRVEAVINVAMLGEGYSHKYLSIAAIFRPFRSELPYIQFIGRILRYIPEGNAKDNVGIIISHKHLYLENLWNKYKKEINESEIINSLRDYDDILDKDYDEPSDGASISRINESLGKVMQSDSHTLSIENYLNTELIEKSKEEEAKIAEQIKKIKEALPNLTDAQARMFIQQTESSSSSLGRPDLIYKKKKQGIDSIIREELVPKLIADNNINAKSDDLKYSNLFLGKYWYLPSALKSKCNNAALIAIYYNAYLKEKIGRPRKEWTDDDYDIAFNALDNLTKYIDGVLKNFYN